LVLSRRRAIPFQRGGKVLRIDRKHSRRIASYGQGKDQSRYPPVRQKRQSIDQFLVGEDPVVAGGENAIGSLQREGMSECHRGPSRVYRHFLVRFPHAIGALPLAVAPTEASASIISREGTGLLETSTSALKLLRERLGDADARAAFIFLGASSSMTA
jgi:hypothetical protein